MAKWGEGDPRWIVEERPDATNVNNWHWTEKNANSWSQEKFKELFQDFVIEVEGYKCTVTGVDTCEGEAMVNNRKGKLIFFYDWNITLKWESPNVDDKKKIEGKINIPNLSEENDISEVDIEFTLSDSSDKGEDIKYHLHTKGQNVVRKQLEKYVSLLKDEFSKGMILPKKDAMKDKITNITSGFNLKMQMNQAVEKKEKNDKVGCKIATTTVKQSQKFMCRAREFYNVMTTPEMAMAFTHGPVKLEPEKGGKFEFFSGNIYGEFVELSPKKIVQKWRCKQWPEGQTSLVTMEIEEKSDVTEVNITQTGVPSNEESSTKENWDKYYWNPIKQTFGFGYFM